MASKFLARLSIFCVAALFVLPFVCSKHTLPIPSFYNEAIAAVLVLTACLAGICLFIFKKQADTGYSLPLIALLFVPLIVVMGIQVILGKLTFPYNALFPSLILIVAIVAMMLGSACVKSFGFVKLLYWISIACIAGGVLNVCAQIVQLTGAVNQFLPWVTYTSGSYYGNLAQRNHLATYLSWSLISVLYLHAKSYLRSLVSIPLIIFLLVGIALTSSRMTWLQISWIALAAGYLSYRMDAAQRPRLWYMVCGLPLVYLVITLALPHVFDLFHFSFNETAIDRIRANTLDSSRWLIYSQSWEIFTANPLWGVGPGELAFNQFLLMDHYDRSLFASSTHNLLLDLLVMSGIVGTSFFLWIFVTWLLRARRITVSLETSCIILFLSVLGIHSLLEFPEWYAFFLFPAAFLMGSMETRFISIKNRILVRIFPAVSVLYGLAFSVILYVQYVQLEALYLGLYLYNTNAIPASEKGIVVIENYRASSFFKAPAEFLLSWTFRLNDIALDRKLEISERAVRYQPEANIIYRHIVLLGLAGQQEKANFYLLRLKKTYPVEFQNIGGGLIKMGIDQPAIFGEIAKEAIRLGASETQRGQ